MEYIRFFDQIKQQALFGAYLLHGEEEYVKASAIHALINSMPETARELNAQTLTEPTAAEVIAACETLPFFADKRLVVAKELSTGETAGLKDYIPAMPESTILLLYYRGNFGNGNSAVYQYLTKRDRVIKCEPLSEDEAVRWVLTQAQRLQLLLDAPVARHLVVLCGTSVSTLYNELNKLASGTEPGEPVTRELLLRLVSPNIEYKMFNMLNSFFAGKKGDGMHAMRQLIKDNPKEVSGMIGFFAAQFRQLYIAKRLLEAKCKEQEAVKRIGGNPYAASKALQNAKRLPMEQISTGFHAFRRAGIQFKTGEATDIQALELALHKTFPEKAAAH